ncbi:probable RNA polymerase II nuclear localization SLC7A6OS [Pelobates cultripes]|uniref:Probable RNA polymerase II nuclear localization protein SLC7A6OS n=1 Tax=Pelobates cultripes TaxID=61616 RepID=A0AAD1WQN1_PELCU|nr:probable RNA polymerase II nuclear localization SLC7A6OS [Pelobates cultripes]
MEASVLRVKRKRGADPAEALVISCKRLRAEQEEAAAAEPGPVVTTQVFRLAATVSSQNEPLQKYINEALSRDRACQALHPSSGSKQRIHEELRTWKHVKRQNSRYRVVSSLRPTLTEAEVFSDESDQPTSPDSPLLSTQTSTEASVCATGHTETNGNFQLFDMVQEEPETASEELKDSDPETIICNSMRMIREKLTVSDQGLEHRENNEEFVYDIYYAEASPHNWIQDILSVQPYTQEQELVADDIEPEEIYEDEDDENEESNWRNDYPDEEDSDQEERYQGYYEESEEENDGWSAYRRKNKLSFLEGDDDGEDTD